MAKEGSERDWNVQQQKLKVEWGRTPPETGGLNRKGKSN